MASMRKTYKRLGYSILLIGLIAIFLFSATLHKHNPLDASGLFFILVFSCFGGQGLFILLALLRLTRVIKCRDNFFYIFVTVFNILVGIPAIFVMGGTLAEDPVLRWCMLTAWAGVIQLMDIFSEDILPGRERPGNDMNNDKM